MPAVAPWSASLAEEVISDEMAKARAFLGVDGENATALLPILHALQHAFGFVPPDAVPLMANRLNISKAEVRGVISFYHDFFSELPGRHVIRICRAEACQATGCERVAAHLERAHALHPGRTTGQVTLQNVYCLGNCALGPAALVDDELVGGFDEHVADTTIARLQEQPA